MIVYVRTDVESSTYHLNPTCQLLNLAATWEKLDDIKGLGELAQLGYVSPCGICGQNAGKARKVGQTKGKNPSQEEGGK